MAEDATQDFTWTGTVPAADASAGIKIKDLSSGVTLDSGVFEVTKLAGLNDNWGDFEITSASILSFDVVTDDANEDHVDYYYTLTNTTYAYDGDSGDADAYTDAYLMADGIRLLRDIKTTTPATGATNLTPAGTASFQYGIEYTLQATMLITDQAI